MMTRILVVLGVCVAVGVPLGILASGRQSAVPPDNSRPAAPLTEAVVHRFPLTAADLKAHQEKPAVAIDGKGRAVVAWATETGDRVRSLMLARSTDGGVTLTEPTAFRPVPVLNFTGMMKGKEVTRVSSVAPRLAAHADTIVLGWTEHRGKGKVEFLVAKSTDGGATFTEPVTAHTPAAVRPTFTALTVGLDGTVACSWLDHRNGVQQPFCSIWPATAAAFTPEVMVYAGPNAQGVCPCCDTEVLRTADGATLVAFRNNDADVRECVVCRAEPGSSTFGSPLALSGHGWKFKGCPHDGPTLAVAGSELHAVWMDAHAGPMRVYHARSTVGGPTFSSTGFKMDSAAPGNQGHPQLAAVGTTLHAVWDASIGDEPVPAAGEPRHAHGAPTGSGRAIVYAAWSGNGSPAASRAVAAKDGAFQTQPALAVGPNGQVLVAWNEIAEAGKTIAISQVRPAE